MPSYMLIHGASHGGWCWRKIVPLLRSQAVSTLLNTLARVKQFELVSISMREANAFISKHHRRQAPGRSWALRHAQHASPTVNTRNTLERRCSRVATASDRLSAAERKERRYFTWAYPNSADILLFGPWSYSAALPLVPSLPKGSLFRNGISEPLQKVRATAFGFPKPQRFEDRSMSEKPAGVPSRQANFLMHDGFMGGSAVPSPCTIRDMVCKQ
jgi:hypothetical protein